MPYETKAQLEARLVKIDDALDKARSSQAYTTGMGAGLTRGSVRALLEERAEVISKLDAITAASEGMANKVRFERPS